jgi:hypothetical protein
MLCSLVDKYTILHRTRPWSSQSLLWEPEISLSILELWMVHVFVTCCTYDMTFVISGHWASGWWAAKVASISLPLVHHPISTLKEIHRIWYIVLDSTLSFSKTDIPQPAVCNVNPSAKSISSLVHSLRCRLHFFRLRVSI